MQNIEIELQKKFINFEEKKVESLNYLDEQVAEINNGLSDFID